MMPAHSQPANDDMPQSIPAEQAIIGAILYDNDLYDIIASTLRPEHFYNPVHETIYGLLAEFIGAGKIADAIMLKDKLSQDQRLQEIGGIEYIADLMMNAASSRNLMGYAQLVRREFQRRKVFDRSKELQEDMLDPDMEDIQATVSNAVSDIDRLIHNRDAGINKSQSSQELADEFLAGLDDITDKRKCDTGFADLDKLLKGLHGERVYIIAGRPAMGKSTVALNIAKNIAKENTGVLFLSLEMGNKDQSPRMIGSIGASMYGPGNFPAVDNLRDEWHKGNKDKIKAAYEAYRRFPIEWEQGQGMNIANIRMTINRAVRKMRKDGHELGCIIIDHVGHIKGNKSGMKIYERMTEVSNELIPLSKVYDCPVLALTQLSRECEKRDDKRPVLSDLRDSGHLEQDAAVVITVYRDYYYAEAEAKACNELTESLQRRLDNQNEIELGVVKNRFGPTGNVRLFTDLSRMLVDNLARDYR